MTTKKQTAIEWLIDELEDHYVFMDLKNTIAYQQAKQMEKEQMNNLPIVMHEGIENTWAYIEDGVIHIRPSDEALETHKPHDEFYGK